MKNLGKPFWILYGICMASFSVLMSFVIILLNSGRIEGYGRPAVAILPALPSILFIIGLLVRQRNASLRGEQV